MAEDSVKEDLIKKSKQLVALCRGQDIPIIHIHTNTGLDGQKAMPHWQEQHYRACIENTQGILAHSSLKPEPQDKIIYKHFFNAFQHTDLGQILEYLQVKSVLIAGLYMHACIRTTAIEAYERGFQVWIASDAVGSTEPLHAELSRIWLAQRIARFYTLQELTQKLGGNFSPPPLSTKALIPVANIFNDWLDPLDLHDALVNRNPVNQEQILSIVPLAGTAQISEAARVGDNAWASWRHTTLSDRVEFLKRWENALSKVSSQLLHLLIEEIGKPYFDAQEEIKRAFAHLDYTLKIL